MSWIILIIAAVAFGWWLNSKRVEDHTNDPDALPCPVCRTASPVKSLGYHVCPNCDSRWLPSGSWVIRFRCGCCGASPVKISQDPYNPSLFAIRFSCGRQGNYNSNTKAKWDRKPCGEQVRQEISKTEDWHNGPAEDYEPAPTKVIPSTRQDSPPEWTGHNEPLYDDYEGETEVIIN